MHFVMKSEKNIEQYSRETTCGLISHTNLQKQQSLAFLDTQPKQKKNARANQDSCLASMEERMTFVF